MNGLPQLARRRPLSKTTIIRGPTVGDIVTTKRSPNWTAVSMAACSAGPILEHRILRPSENVISYACIESESIGSHLIDKAMTPTLRFGAGPRRRGRAGARCVVPRVGFQLWNRKFVADVTPN